MVILIREIYMEQPEGFAAKGMENQVCKLVNSLYGLKQSPRCWNVKFNEFLLKFGLSRSTSDPCVYFRRQGEEFTLVVIFVDDGLICSNKEDSLNNILEHLRTEFEMRTMSVDRFLGLNIFRDRNQHLLFLTQTHFTTTVLEKFNMSECNPKLIPADPGTRLSSNMGPKDNEEMETMAKVPYREAVGFLMYIMTMTRPDIAFAVSQVAQHCQNPGLIHWSAIKRILSYLAGTLRHGICFHPSNTSSITGYADADYAGDLDKRRSTTGFVFLFHGGPMSWTSRRQSCTALSTTEAEYMSACDASKEANWISWLLHEITGKETGPIPLFCDSQSAIRLTKNPEFHQRTKHVDVKYHFVREQQSNGLIDIKFVGSENQVADIFTKPLPRPRFNNLREKVGVMEPLPGHFV